MYIRTETFAGFDWHDICVDNRQILIDNSPIIYDVNSVLYAHIQQTLCKLNLTSVANKFTFQTFSELHEHEFSYQTDDEDQYHDIFIHYQKDNNTYHLAITLENGYEYRVDYDIYDTKQPVYLPVAKYFYGLKYGDTQERFFCTHTFSSYEEAYQFMVEQIATKNTNYVIDQYQDYQIFVFDKEKLEHLPWYQYNKSIMEYVNKISLPEYKKIANPYTIAEYEKLCKTNKTNASPGDIL